MKKIRRIGIILLLLCLLMVDTALADQWSWEEADGHHNQSVLLSNDVLSAEDSVNRYARGDYLAEGSVQITNMQDGTLRVNALTLAYRNVDLIMHTVFLDVWNEDRNDWINLGYWDFEQTKEEVENEELSMLSTSFILTGYETNLYYRLRGLHGVEFNDELEACATETNGVLLTDWQN